MIVDSDRMSKSFKKIILFTVGGLVGFLALTELALRVFVDIKTYQPRLEALASEALGMEVRVDGRLGLSIFPGFHVWLEDAHIRNRGAEIVSTRKASLGIDLLPLLRQEVRIGMVALDHPKIYIERDHEGKFNFEKPEETKGTIPAMDLTKVSLSDGMLLYADKQSEAGLEAADCRLVVRHLRIAERENSNLSKRLSFTAEFACGTIRTKNCVVSDLKVAASGKSGVFEIKPVTMHLFGGQGSGSLRADFSGAVPLYRARYSLPQFRIEEFFKNISPKKTAEGVMDFSMNLSLQGKTANEIRQGAEGQVSLRGRNLTLHGSDLDREFVKFESSQNFSLVDAGAFFFAGPLGLAATKGYSLASVLHGSSEGNSSIPILVSDWKIEHGVAQAQDVALSTNENRIALQGRLDFVNDRFNDITLALIDAQGCVKVQQKISGAFQKPVMEKASMLKSLAAPAIKLFKKGRDLFPGGGKCEQFYAGSVAPPVMNKLGKEGA